MEVEREREREIDRKRERGEGRKSKRGTSPRQLRVRRRTGGSKGKARADGVQEDPEGACGSPEGSTNIMQCRPRW